MSFKKLLSATVVTGALLGAPLTFASIITLNPQAPNTGASGGTALDTGTSAFNTDNILGNLTSVLQINATSGATSWSESGTIELLQANLSNVAQTSGFGRASATSGSTYDVYLTFLSTGTGLWATGSNFAATGVTTLNVNVWASPASCTSYTPGTPTSSTDSTGGSTAGSCDFLLATASVLSDPTNGGLASIGAGSTGSASTSLSALLSFSPVSGTTGPTGFFEFPNPFLVNFGSSSSTNTLESTFVKSSSNVIITTAISTVGSSNITPETRIPEPGVLSLVGISLLGIALAGRRKKGSRPA